MSYRYKQGWISSIYFYLDGLIGAQVDILLDFLLQEVVRLGLLNARTSRSISAIVSGRIGLEQLRSELIIDADQDHGATERTHLSVLRVHLIDIGDAFAEKLDRNVVAELVLEALRFVDGALNLRSAVGDHSSHHAADAASDPVQVGHCRRVQRLVLIRIILTSCFNQ